MAKTRLKEKTPAVSRRYPRQKRSQETVDAILEATAQILVRSGPIACSTNHIAERAGVSIGGLYQYFPNREAILRSLCLRERKKDLEAIETCLNRMPGAKINDLTQKLIETALARLSDDPALRQILDQELPGNRSEPGMRAFRVQLAKLLAQRLQESLNQKLHDDLELRLYVLVSGIEASFYAAIKEYGHCLDRSGLIIETTELVIGFIQRLVGSSLAN